MARQRGPGRSAVQESINGSVCPHGPLSPTTPRSPSILALDTISSYCDNELYVGADVTVRSMSIASTVLAAIINDFQGEHFVIWIDPAYVLEDATFLRLSGHATSPSLSRNPKALPIATKSTRLASRRPAGYVQKVLKCESGKCLHVFSARIHGLNGAMQPRAAFKVWRDARAH